MTSGNQLVVVANRRYLWGVVAVCTVFAAIVFALVPSASPRARIALYLSGTVMASAAVLGLLRFRMARVPQLVADEDGFTVATLFTRRSFSWSDLERIEETYFATPFGRRRVRKPKRMDFIYGEVPNHFRFRARGRLYGVMAPPKECGSLDAARDEFERMWREHARSTP